MKFKGVQNKEELYLNTNEIIHDYEFYFQLIIEGKKMDFEYENK